ncbi:hypothetical protein AAD027_16205 [Pseudoxanthomonas putridarboris]|uniref:Uncharacterized protein n=2 Tax=Pseudoxanthomonas putridarboris TaxID=752605 RepID=A0ABU9J3U2_9GAMM
MSTCLTALFRVSTAVDPRIEIELQVRDTDPRLAVALLDVSYHAARHAVQYAIEEGGLGARPASAAGPPVAWDTEHIFKGNTNEH